MTRGALNVFVKNQLSKPTQIESANARASVPNATADGPTMPRNPKLYIQPLGQHLPTLRKRVNAGAVQENLCRCHPRASMSALCKRVNADAAQEYQCTRDKEPFPHEPISRASRFELGELGLRAQVAMCCSAQAQCTEPRIQVAALSSRFCVKLKLPRQLEGRRLTTPALAALLKESSWMEEGKLAIPPSQLLRNISRTSPSSQRLASAVETARGSPMLPWPGSSMSSSLEILETFAPNFSPRLGLYSSCSPRCVANPRHRLLPPTVLRKCTNAPASAPNATEIGQLNDPLGIDIRSSRPQCLCSDASRTCTMARRPDRSMTHLVDLHIPIRRKRANGDAAQEQMIRCHARASMTMLSKGVNADAMQERQCTRAKGIDPARARPIPRRPGSLMISRTLPLDQADASARTTRRVKSGPSRGGIRREARSLSPRIDRALCNVFVLGTNGFSLDVDGLSLDNERQEHRAERQEVGRWSRTDAAFPARQRNELSRGCAMIFSGAASQWLYLVHRRNELSSAAAQCGRQANVSFVNDPRQSPRGSRNVRSLKLEAMA
ncbi:hypothetical protein EV715DRAFT_266605 [Schizophyllum commune]